MWISRYDASDELLVATSSEEMRVYDGVFVLFVRVSWVIVFICGEDHDCIRRLER